MANIAERNILFRIQTDTKKAQRDINAVKKDVTGLNGVVRNAAANFAGLAAFDVAGRITSGLQDITKQSISLALAAEQTTVAFETFLGSADAARKVLGELNEFSTVTPFEPEQVIQAGKALLAFGFTAEELVPNLKAIGDLSAGTGKDFNELALIFGKARTQGTLFAEDINQLTEAGIPIIAQFAKQFGVAESEIKKLVTDGRIGFKDLQQAFTELTSEGGKFFDLTAKQSRTVAGRISTLVGNFNALAKSIGERLLPTIGALVGTFGGFVGLARELVEVSPAEELEKERIELNLLVTELTDANTEENRRKQLIDELQKRYPSFLKNIDDEAITTEFLRKQLNEANKAFAARIALSIEEERLQKARRNAGVQLADELVAERRLSQAVLEITEKNNFQNGVNADTLAGRVKQLKELLSSNSDLIGDLRTISTLEGFVNLQRKNTTEFTEDANKAQKDLTETQEKLAPLLQVYNELFGDSEKEIKKTTEATRTLNKEEQKLADDRQKRANALLSQIEKDRIAAEDELRKQIQETTEAEVKQNNDRIKRSQLEAEANKQNQQDIIDAGDQDQREAELADEREIESLKVKEDTDKAEVKSEEDKQKQIIDLSKQTANAILSVAEQQTAAQIEQLDILLAAQRERVQSAVITAERGNAELLQAEEDRLTELTNARERAAERQQRIAQIQVAANQLVAVSEGIVAVTRAFAEGSFVQGIATSVALAAQVAAVIASINSAANSAQGFAEGTEFVTGPGTSTSDSIPARLSKGERVVPANVNARYYDALNEFQYATPKADMMAALMSGNGGQSTDMSTVEMHLQHMNDRLDNLEMNVTLDKNGFSASMQKLQYKQSRKNKLV